VRGLHRFGLIRDDSERREVQSGTGRAIRRAVAALGNAVAAYDPDLYLIGSILTAPRRVALRIALKLSRSA
jgi:hypothetical protein